MPVSNGVSGAISSCQCRCSCSVADWLSVASRLLSSPSSRLCRSGMMPLPEARYCCQSTSLSGWPGSSMMSPSEAMASVSCRGSSRGSVCSGSSSSTGFSMRAWSINSSSSCRESCSSLMACWSCWLSRICSFMFSDMALLRWGDGGVSKQSLCLMPPLTI